MSMIDRVFLQRSISAALSARQVRSKAQAVKRKAKRQQRSELAASRQLVASIRQEREAAAMRARARKNLPDSLTGRRPQKNRFSRSAPSLQQSPPTGVPRLKLANALKSRRRRESEPNGPVVMPADAQGMQRPDNMWKVVNDNVARQARADEARDKRRKKKLAAEWQRDLQIQMEEQRRAREERKQYDARYARLEAQQIRDGQRKDALERAALEKKHAKERHMRREQVEDARRRRQQRMALEEQERQQNNRIFAEKEAKRKAEERAKVRENRQWLKEVAETNKKNMAQAHKRMLQTLHDERKLASVWKAQLDAQDKRRQQEFDAIYAASAKAQAFGEMMNIDPEAKAKEDEARAVKWQTRQWAKADREAKAKEARRKKLITDQQQYLDQQVERERQLRHRRFAEEQVEQRRLIAADQEAVRKAEREKEAKRRANLAYKKDLERQRAFDRRRAKNAKVPGSMNTVEVLMNRHTLKEAITIARKRQATQR